MLELLNSIHISNKLDSYEWSLGIKKQFTFKEARSRLDHLTLPCGVIAIRWNKFLLIKINIFTWKLILKRLSARCNVVMRSIDLSSILCPCCGEAQEDVVHLFLKCSLAKESWQKFAKWVDISIPNFDSIDLLFTWVDDFTAGNFRRLIMDSMCVTLIWVLWTYRNVLVFGNV